MLELSRDGEVFVLRMQGGENRMQPDFVREWNAALDEVEGAPGPAAMVTAADGKIWSNGLDVAALARLGGEGIGAFMGDLDRLFARVLTFARPTAAAIGGHAFAAGGMLALAHDFRVMRADRGFFCLPEVDMAMKRGFSDGMTAVLRARLPAVTLHEAVVTGRRYGGAEAVARGIFDEAVAEERVLPRAIEWARAMAGKDPETVRALKRGIHRDALAVLERPGPHPL